jgi:signal transduction histidine kinase
VLTARRSIVREWGLFALVALLPALAVGLLALRALHNEEAAIRRELSLQLEQVAARAQQRYDDALRQLGNGAVKNAVFADTIDVPPQADEPTKPSSHQRNSKKCDELSAAFRKAESQPRKAVADDILKHCRSARTSSGGMLWLIVALDVRQPAASIEAWLREHGAELGAAERAATAMEITQTKTFDSAERGRLHGLLDGKNDSAASHLLSGRRKEMHIGKPVISWRDARSAGHLTRRSDGRYVGQVVHAGSLARAVRSGWPLLASEMTASLSVRATPPDGPSVELLTKGAYLAIAWRDPQLVEHRTNRSKMVLAGAASLAGLIAILLAALLFARMRSERRLSALRTDFVAAVSHELRTPIASIRMLSELFAEDRVEEAEKDEMHQALAREAKRLSTTVDRLLGFSRMEAGKQRARRQRCDVSQLVADAIDAFEARDPSSAPVERALDDDVSAAIDAGAVSMALDNLLNNARKYAPDGRPYRVSLSKSRTAIRIAVSDRGPGIAPRDQKRIFRPFERADDRLSTATEGSGIGLSLVGHVARSHGGSAHVESKPGDGATFIFELASEA